MAPGKKSGGGRARSALECGSPMPLWDGTNPSFDCLHPKPAWDCRTPKRSAPGHLQTSSRATRSGTERLKGSLLTIGPWYHPRRRPLPTPARMPALHSHSFQEWAPLRRRRPVSENLLDMESATSRIVRRVTELDYDHTRQFFEERAEKVGA